MNQEIKAIIDLGVAVAQVGVDVAQKKSLPAVLMDLEQAGMDVPAVIASAGDLSAEVAALKDPAAEADLIAYVGGKIGAVVSGPKAQAIVAASVKLASDLAADVGALVAAVSMPADPAPAA